jgi:hypothetical protein
VNTRPGLRASAAEDLELHEGRLHELVRARAPCACRSRSRSSPRLERLLGAVGWRSGGGRRIDERRSAALTRLRNSRIENGLVM